jgi:hypothetical protein
MRMDHKYMAGQTVNMSPTIYGRFETVQSYTIVRCMPEVDGELQYRIRGLSDERERVVKERDCAPVSLRR